MLFCVLFILDCMNSVGIAELNNVFDVFVSVWNRKKIPVLRMFPFCCLDLYGIFSRGNGK